MSKPILQKENFSSNREEAFLSLIHADSSLVHESMLLLEQIAHKHHLTLFQVGELLQHKEKYASVPALIFRSSLGPLEALVKYMKDVLEYSFADIAHLLHRDETTIWTSYHHATHKEIEVWPELSTDFKKLRTRKENLIVPVSAFSDRKLSILESLCMYLKNTFSLSCHAIAALLGRDDRTIWTVLNRGAKKLQNE